MMEGPAKLQPVAKVTGHVGRAAGCPDPLLSIGEVGEYRLCHNGSARSLLWQVFLVMEPLPHRVGKFFLIESSFDATTYIQSNRGLRAWYAFCNLGGGRGKRVLTCCLPRTPGDGNSRMR